MELPSQDAADYLNFVLKDASTNTWYDSNGSNFKLALRTALRSFMSMDDAEFVRPHISPFVYRFVFSIQKWAICLHTEVDYSACVWLCAY